MECCASAVLEQTMVLLLGLPGVPTSQQQTVAR